VNHTGDGGCAVPATAVVAADGDGGSVVLPSLSLLVPPLYSLSFFVAATVLPALLLATALPVLLLLLLPVLLLVLLLVVLVLLVLVVAAAAAAAFVAGVHTDL
jgi:hypothetical protein